MKNTNDKINLEKDNDGLLSFSANSDTIYLFRDKIFGAFSKKGINVTVTSEWKKGIFDLFSVELVNAPDFSKENYLLLSNHISDFDAVLLGLLYRDIRIIAKMGWISNPELSKFLEHHYNIVGIYRQVEMLNEKEQNTANSHNLKVLTDAMRYLKNKEKAQHLLIFPQGTISNINHNSIERINDGFAKIALATGVSVINIFLEFPSTQGKTRIIFSDPYKITERNIDYRGIWMQNMIKLQNKLDNVREPVLNEKYKNNNKPGDEFF